MGASRTKTQTLRVNAFPGGFNWPIFAGQDRGLFRSEGLSVELEATPGSVMQMTGLSEGRFEIAMTAIDNVIAYVEGQGEAPIGPQPEFFAFMGSDSGFLHLVGAPGIQTVQDLKGRTLSVDALTTGYAFVLLEILRRAGLQDGDCRIERVGGMAQRLQALLEGRQDATLLSSPYHYLAQEKGFRVIGRATDLVGCYQGNVAAARRSWAANNREALIGFVRGYIASVRWLGHRAHRRDAIALLMKHVPSISEDLAANAYDELFHPVRGFNRNGRISLEGLRNVLALRSHYAKPSKCLIDPMVYCDLSLPDAALAA